MSTLSANLQMEVITEVQVGSEINQLRVAPVQMGAGREEALIAIHSAQGNIDPWQEEFRYPKDTYKLTLFTRQGEILWQRDLGWGIVPGTWFCPVYPFDLDGDGVDEIWLITNSDTVHPLRISNYKLERIHALTGETMGAWKWPNLGGWFQSLSHSTRNFILGGHVHGEPVLITAQGTYGPMFIQGWNPDMSERWTVSIPKEAPGARGSHMNTIVDINNDGVDELIWGERCFELHTGSQLFCADEDTWQGHTDIVQPVWDMQNDRWYIYTTRESFEDVGPRVVLYNHRGERVWAQLDSGHMHTGWVARIGDSGEQVALATNLYDRPNNRSAEHIFNAYTGQRITLPYEAIGTFPIDVNGDGIHELVRGKGEIMDRRGRIIGQIESGANIGVKLWGLPGEQIINAVKDGRIRIWADRQAVDTSEAKLRFEHPYYKANRRGFAVGYNKKVLCGL